MINLVAYLERIGFTGACEPTWETLKALHFAHVCAIPFENLDSWLGDEVKLELPHLEQKLVHERRGGYCYEHNTFFVAVLRQIGFEPHLHLARVRWQIPAEVVTARSHLCIRVETAGHEWLVDPGFGGVGLTTPIQLGHAGEQKTSHDSRRLQPLPNGDLMHQMNLGAQNWADVYQVEQQRIYPVDVRGANWFTSTHPTSRFRRNLVITRVQNDHRRILLDREFVRRFTDGRVEREIIDSGDRLREILVDQFDLPSSHPVLARVQLPAITPPSS